MKLSDRLRATEKAEQEAARTSPAAIAGKLKLSSPRPGADPLASLKHRAQAALFARLDRETSGLLVLARDDDTYLLRVERRGMAPLVQAVEVVRDRQVVLPHDFWNPTHFTLDPEIRFLLPRFVG